MANDGYAPTRRGRKGGRSITEPKSVATNTDLMLRAAALRATGASFRHIGEVLSIDPTWARTLVLRALEASAYEAADLMRTQEGQRLDRLQQAIWGQALAGDTRAVTAVLRIMERRAKLFGLDAPIQVEMEPPPGHDEVDEALRVILGHVVE